MKKSIPLIIISLLILIFAGCNNSNHQAEKVEVDITLFDNISDPNVSCYRIPAIDCLPNGLLLAVCDQRVESCGDLRHCKDINLVIRKSHDNGQTWTEMETLVDYEYGTSASDPSIIIDKVNNVVFVFYNYMDLINYPNKYRFMYVKSTDNCQTWSEPVDVTDQLSWVGWNYHFKFITSGRGIQCKDGTLMHTIVNLNTGLFLFGSYDFGENWELISSAILPGDESKVAELNDGTLLINSRINNAGYRYIHTSTNKGRTWTSVADTALTDPGCNAAFFNYASFYKNEFPDVLVFVNANSKNNRKNLTLKTSYDKGETWNEEKTIYEGSAAYSSATVLKNGNLGILYEKDDYTKIQFVTINKDFYSK